METTNTTTRTDPPMELITLGGRPHWRCGDWCRPVVRGGDGPDDEAALKELDDAGLSGVTAEDFAVFAAGAEDAPPAGDKQFTQAEVDAVIDKRLARERKAWEKKQKDEAARAELTEAERLKAEKEDAERAAGEHTSAADARVVKAEAKVVALAAGVKADRLARFLRNVDLDDIDVEDGEPDTDAIAKAVEAALAEVPEFKGEAPKTGASGGSGFGKEGQKIWTRAEVDALSPADFDKNEAEIMAQLAAGTIK